MDMQNNKDLADPGDYFKRTWEIYKRRVWVLIAIYIVTLVLAAAAFGICLGLGYLFDALLHVGRDLLPALGVAVGLIAGITIFTWGTAAVIYAVAEEDLDFKGAFGKGRAAIGPFMWLITLLGYIIPGGFLLFVVPGVLFSVWFAFAQFIFVAEGRRGMDCLLRSKEYVRGMWAEVFLRLFLVWLASFVIGFVPVVGVLLSFLFTPFIMIFIWLLYKDVKELKGEVTYSTAAGEKFKWVGVATLGYLALPLLVFSVVGASIISAPCMLVKRFFFFKGF